jgi:UDP-N-acetylglucosamine:LPS N-acetylglucosamine transferase
VDPRCRPGDRVAARAATGLRPDAFVVLVSGGSLGFGGLEPLVDAVLAGGGPAQEYPVQAVVLCGRNERLRARLEARGEDRQRLAVYGWTDEVAQLVTAADVVLTTAGGMIASEALAAGRPVLFATPVPGHGRAGAEMTAAAGLAVVCPRPEDVTAAVRRLLHDPTALAALAGRAAAFGQADMDAELAALAGRTRSAAGETAAGESAAGETAGS